jgi:NADH dehydrogenase
LSRQYASRSGVLSRSKTVAKYAGLFFLSSTIGIVTIGAGILVHDAFTYSERHIDRVPINPLALHPEHGGPKNLPIARVLVDDDEDEEAKAMSEKPKLVIVGSGWGVSLVFILFYQVSQGSASYRLSAFLTIFILGIIT